MFPCELLRKVAIARVDGLHAVEGSLLFFIQIILFRRNQLVSSTRRNQLVSSTNVRIDDTNKHGHPIIADIIQLSQHLPAMSLVRNEKRSQAIDVRRWIPQDDHRGEVN